MSNSFITTLGQRLFRIDTANEHHAVVDGITYAYSLTHIRDDKYSLILNGKCFEIVASVKQGNETAGDEEVLVSVNGKHRIALVSDERTYRLTSLFASSAAKPVDQTVRAPMPGLISRLEVAVGDNIAPGTGLLVLEAMKMENEIRATSKGTVTRIFVEKGKVVEKGEPLLTIAGS